ncbi:hypothetical protein [Chryseobacterium sp.]|uniref:hypothetical protein n=1 Tax=Chryseobacterium sp. TaxID=1871047 RepID=UPI00321B41A9
MYAEILDQTQRELALSIGGYTVTEGQGGYYDEGGIVHDHVALIEVWYQSHQESRVLDIFHSAAASLLVAGEHSVLTVVNGQAALAFAEELVVAA